MVRAKKITVQEHIDASISMTYNEKILDYTEITNRPKKANPEKVSTIPRKIYIPPRDHPWRKFTIKSYPQYVQF